MEQADIQIDFNARYYKLGKLGPQTKNLWFVLHGYGQLAQYFIRNFKVLEQEETCIIAPEALSRFYLNGFSGKVGATWMTKENRLADIDNYVNYLDSIYRKELGNTDKNNSEKLHITLLGFSQGSATAVRWALGGNSHFHRLILWAGTFPHDMELKDARKILSDKETFFIYGDKDPFLTEQNVENQAKIIENLGLSAKKIVFEGVHQIHGPTLSHYFKET